MATGVYPHKKRGSKYLFYLGTCTGCEKSPLGRTNSTGLCVSCARKKNPIRYWLGKKRPDFAEWQRGRKFSPETRKRLSESHKGNLSYWKGKKRPDMQGEKHPNWNGNPKYPDKKIRTSWQYKEWRRHVYQRDDYTCQACGQRGGKLQADHELPFALYPDLRFEILNGRTLCVPCHIKTPTYGGRSKKKQYD